MSRGPPPPQARAGPRPAAEADTDSDRSESAAALHIEVTSQSLGFGAISPAAATSLAWPGCRSHGVRVLIRVRVFQVVTVTVVSTFLVSAVGNKFPPTYYRPLLSRQDHGKMPGSPGRGLPVGAGVSD